MNTPEPNLTRLLEEALAYAREGRITSIAIALAGPETHTDTAEWHASGDMTEPHSVERLVLSDTTHRIEEGEWKEDGDAGV